MIERNVTRAAERLGRTQSAVSHSLSRLRSQLGDPLLIKGGVRMQPTAFALDLIEQARPMLRGIERVLSPRHVFDPACSRRVFRLAAPDFVPTLFTSLLARLRSDAPGVSVEWTTAREPTLLDVAEGQIDIAIVPAQLRMPDGVNSEAIGALKWRCFGRQRHPAFSKWGRKSWSQWPHLAGESRSRRSGAGAEHRRVGTAFLRHRPCSGWLGFADHTAVDCDGRDFGPLSAGQPGSSVSDRAASACDDLEHRPNCPSRDHLAA